MSAYPLVHCNLNKRIPVWGESMQALKVEAVREAVEFSPNEDADTSSPKKVSALPAWLVSSFASVEKFKITAAKTRESIQHLQKTCKRFDELKRRSDEYFAERERLMRSRQTFSVQKRKCAFLELLPTEVYGKILLYLPSEDILTAVAISKTLRIIFELEDENCWQPLAAKRWYLQQLDKERSEHTANKKEKTWREKVLVRCAAMSGIKRLLLKYKHERIPKTSNGSKTSQREWISALTGLVFLCSNKHDTMTRDLVCRYGGARFLLSLTQHNSHWIRRISVGALANLLTSCVDKKYQKHERFYRETEKYNGTSILRDLLCSPVSDVETMASQEAARCLINIHCPLHPIIASEHELLVAHEWNILRTHASNRKALTKIPFNFKSSLKNQNFGSWTMIQMYQSGTRKSEGKLSLCFMLNGEVIGSGYDMDRGPYFLRGEWYGLESADGKYVSVKAGSLFMKKWYGLTREMAMNSSASTFYRGFWYSGTSSGFMGIWENNMSGIRRQSMKLVHGGGFFRAIPDFCNGSS